MKSEATIVKHGSHPGFDRTETVQVEKRGGPLGSEPRYYVVSLLLAENRIPETVEILDMVDEMLGLVFKKGDADVETLAFRIPSLDESPESWTEVAGGMWNGASIEQIVEEILRNEEL